MSPRAHLLQRGPGRRRSRPDDGDQPAPPLALIDREGHPTGIVSLGDLAANGYEELAARVLIAISQSVPAISGSPWLR
jgi:hypothetical protein